MHYQISRNGQMYGPYTIEDLQRYVASGHVLSTDLAKSEDMAEWVPVSQLLGGAAGATPPAAEPAGYGSAPAAGYPPSYPPAGYPPAGYAPPEGSVPGSAYEGPPNLHWALVLLFDVLTCSLFQMIWNIILAAWFKRIYPASKTLVLYISSAALLLLQAVTGQATGMMMNRHGYSHGHAGHTALYGLIAIACWVVRLVARFTFRGELEQHYNTTEPIGLRINPVLTFFFGGIYLQSQMNRINQIKQGMRYR